MELATRYNSHLEGLHVEAIMAAPPLSLTYAASGLGPGAPEERGNGEANFPERLALESGRPVLVIPYVGRYPGIGRNVVIAWKAGRETTRGL